LSGTILYPFEIYIFSTSLFVRCKNQPKKSAPKLVETIMVIKAQKKKEPKRVVLEKRFAGIPAGAILFVATPEIVAEYVRGIPSGQTRTVEQMRRDLAKRNKAEATCPVSTAIFLRSVAEISLKRLGEGASRENVVPFWRIIAPETPIAKRLALDPDWIAHQRALEAAEPSQYS
jgi:hypothetical protein